MALEHRFTKLSLHEQGKDMVLGKSRPKDSNGKDYKLARDGLDFPIIPSPNIFNFPTTSNTKSQRKNIPDLALPIQAECAAHLEFLETLYVLRQKILVSTDLDEVMNTGPKREEKTGAKGDTKVFKDEGLWERRQKKWPKFVEFATVRFLKWREQFNLTQTEITEDNLPPLDILMVWHSFLLNPKLFRQTCSEEPLFSVKFPWKHIHDSINNFEWSFILPPTAAANYEESSGLAPNLFDDMISWKISLSHSLWSISRLGLSDTGTKTFIEESPGKEYVQLFKDFDSSLARQLRDAVIRQASFVDKMNSFMWIRSPALEGTIRRGISRYLDFCRLLKMSKTTVVPTLDIDLVWHTHQCTAKHYGQAMKVLAGKFVNHDDTIEKPELGDGFEETRRLYRVYFGQEYRVCGCWDCQALLTEIERAMEGGGDVDMDKIAEKVKEDVFYHRAVEWAHRHKLMPPMRRGK
ncbi:hypothetical protein F53441_12242 [Fusarium austroafricanum]|uniref:Glycine-rich domain-containing protein 1 n=1 Tax=Fusarium austroafricanum TaxID=2364996 RepID=A0A8H4JZ07_9HYPO|nr:hypothetical protein F53441_12242 [Fusarium austroafricanum]